MQESKNKNERILDIYTQLLEEKVVNKEKTAEKYEVNKRSIQRDFEEIRAFLDKKRSLEGKGLELIYDRRQQGYRLVDKR